MMKTAIFCGILLASSLLGYGVCDQHELLKQLSDISVDLLSIAAANGEVKTNMSDVATLISTLTTEAVALEKICYKILYVSFLWRTFRNK